MVVNPLVLNPALRRAEKLIIKKSNWKRKENEKKGKREIGRLEEGRRNDFK